MEETRTAIKVAPILVRVLYKMLRFIFPVEETFWWDLFLFPFIIYTSVHIDDLLLSGIQKLFPDIPEIAIGYITDVAIVITAIVLYRAVVMKDVIPKSRCDRIVEWEHIKRSGELVKTINTSKGVVFVYKVGEVYKITPKDYSIPLKNWNIIARFYRDNRLSNKDISIIEEALSSL